MNHVWRQEEDGSRWWNCVKCGLMVWHMHKPSLGTNPVVYDRNKCGYVSVSPDCEVTIAMMVMWE